MAGGVEEQPATITNARVVKNNLNIICNSFFEVRILVLQGPCLKAIRFYTEIGSIQAYDLTEDTVINASTQIFLNIVRGWPESPLKRPDVNTVEASKIYIPAD